MTAWNDNKIILFVVIYTYNDKILFVSFSLAFM